MKNYNFMAALGGIALSLVMAPASLAGSAPTAPVVIFSDSFEDPENTQNWQVYDDFGDWSTTEGAGIEIQTSGVVVDAFDGNQYVELDSYNNSTMTRMLTNLGTGTYELTWYYQPRTNREGDNGIEVALENSSGAGVNLVGDVSVDMPRMSTTDWDEMTTLFSLSTAGTYALSFSAVGTSNSFGGFIDLVTLTQFPSPQDSIGEVPLPAAAWLFLSVLGAGGMIRRFKGKA